MHRLYSLDLGNLVFILSEALDLAHVKFRQHSHRVAAIALNIAKQLDLPSPRLKRIALGGLLHDIGISSTQQKLEAINLIPTFEVQEHCRVGYDILNNFSPLADVAPLVGCHHSPWKETEDQHCFDGNIIFLADRVEILIEKTRPVLMQREGILTQIRQISHHFSPRALAALEQEAQREAFWLEMDSDYMLESLKQAVSSFAELVSLPELRKTAEVFAAVIDRKSPYTHRHSVGVAEKAAALARAVGFSSLEIEEMYIAGLLHDLGKLSIPDEILEKPEGLTVAEMNVIKQHTFYTYHLLQKVPNFKKIADWAAFHHERIDGKGYPFRVDSAGLSLGARIMAVSDVHQALIEERPYRLPMEKGKAIEILYRMAADGALDPRLVKLSASI